MTNGMTLRKSPLWVKENGGDEVRYSTLSVLEENSGDEVRFDNSDSGEAITSDIHIRSFF